MSLQDDAQRGPFMRFASGARFYLLDPRPADIDIRDVAVSLAFSNRYLGALRVCSIAQHCVLVSRLCDPADAREGLGHDFPESVTGDWISPVKRALRQLASTDGRAQSDIDRLEAPIVACFAQRFALRQPLPESVIRADAEALVVERRTDFVGDDPPVAKHKFLQRFRELFPEVT